VGYSLPEIKGKHHRIFCEPSLAESAEYREFWAKLNRGESQSAEYKHIGKDGKDIWVQASYNPVLDSQGKPTKVITVATDITAKKIEALDNAGQIAAIERSQAVAAFNLDGTVITANKNFLNAMGYSLGEVQGKHDGMFVETSERQSSTYREFWAKLNRGESQSVEYKRIGKDGKEVWIQALYNPILDHKGKPFKIVKYAKEMSASIRDLYETMTRSAQIARAAEAGQGFSVVAGEVENLVSHANRATDEARDSEAELPSLSMRRMEARRRNANASRFTFSQFLADLRDGLGNAMLSSTRAVVNFL
jgi:methyl-accepting chemotaxis protein